MTTQAEADHLQAVLDAEIPLTRAIGIRVERCSADAVTLAAPLEPNTNHKATAFGGSLYSVAVLAGWGLLHLQLKALGVAAHIVIQETRVRYLCPVTGDIRATARLAPEQSLERALAMYRRRGRARLVLVSTVSEGGQTAVEFHGTYVIHR